MTNTLQREPLGIAVIGTGRIGSMRASITVMLGLTPFARLLWVGA